MHFYGILAGAATFLIIGISHPLVVKAEYYFGRISWLGFFLAGLVFLIASVLTINNTLSTIWGACAFSLFWGVKEVFDQEKRIIKGWFPENPKRSAYYAAKRKKYYEKQNK
ncbi:MAG: DUF4491 family protein [Bacteroidales bacterium]|nr:DUF4491 family protein [Bacteroidales bacterium]